MFPIGTLTNVAAVVFGGFLGLVLRGRMPESCRKIVFQGLGLCTLVIGIRMAITFEQPLTLIFSIVLGGIAGELLHLEERFDSAATRLKNLVKSDNALFSDGMVTAFLIFCIGPMTILGAFDEGLRQDPTLLYTKSMLDCFAAIALATTYGAGVLFSAIPLLLYQYGLTFFASGLESVFSKLVTTQLTATGGVLIIGIGCNLLELKRIKLTNLLPALLLIVPLTWIVGG